MVPLIVLPISPRWAVSTSLFLPDFWTSFNSPTTKTRGLLMPHLLMRRTSWKPAGTSGAMVTVNWVPGGGGGGGGGGFLGWALGGGGGGGMMGVALRPG